MPFANERKGDDVGKKVNDGAGGEKRERKEDVPVMRVDLKAHRGIVLYPGGMDVENFETSVVRGSRRLLYTGTGEVRDRVTKTW